MWRAGEDNDEGEKITISILIRSKLQSELTIKWTESLLILTAEDINRSDIEQSSEKSSQLELRDDHPHWRKHRQVTDKLLTPHK